jgi:GNAT superfamily N-acetyltransferase
MTERSFVPPDAPIYRGGGRRAPSPTLFSVGGRNVVRLSTGDAPILQRLLESCAEYYELVEGAPAGPGSALGELTEGPAERVPHDLFCLGIIDRPNTLAGVIGALRGHRREGQWYVGLMLLDPSWRGRGFGRAAYAAFEEWIIGQGADSVLLAVVEANERAARFWQGCGFGAPRRYPERTIGQRRHVLIEFEKKLSPQAE